MGFRSYQMCCRRVRPAGSVGQGLAGREVGIVKRGDAKADPGSPKKTRVGFG